jgi:hypothetical protein
LSVFYNKSLKDTPDYLQVIKTSNKTQNKTEKNKMNEKNEKLKETIGYFRQKLREMGVSTTRDHYVCDGVSTYAHLLPETDTGRYMTLFLDLDYNSPKASAHVLVQSDECEEIVTFEFEGDRIMPDSRSGLRGYQERLERIVSAKEGIDLAFEAYRNGSNRTESNKPNAPRQSLLGLMQI